MIPQTSPLIDPFGRAITYLRVSVTDRCDFRCMYCMAENMTFLPKKDLLTLEELDRLCIAFISRGTRRIRLTGGEPLTRRNILQLIRSLGEYLQAGDLDEITMTTNGSQLARYAQDLYQCGMRRINVSLDTLDSERFHAITRWGRLEQVLEGIEAALDAGLKIKINTVALKNLNEEEIPDLISWAHGRGMDIALIETMPLGEVEEDRIEYYLPLSLVRRNLEQRWHLKDSAYKTSGPARYTEVQETGGRLGFITPLSHNFCSNCNRVRITCTGKLFLCLGQEDYADLRAPLRADPSGRLLDQAIIEAITRKPKGHDFVIEKAGAPPALARHMSMTGG